MKTECNYPDCDPQFTTCLMGHGKDLMMCPHSESHANWVKANAKADTEYMIQQGLPIKALCWKQPFASLMLPPWNKVETRTQKVNYRGLVLIVATKVPYSDRDLVELCGGEQALMLEMKVAGHHGYINGAAIGIGVLQDCTNIVATDKTFIKPEHHANRLAWRFGDVFPIEPIAMPGFQGWRNVEPELRSQIKLL